MRSTTRAFQIPRHPTHTLSAPDRPAHIVAQLCCRRRHLPSPHMATSASDSPMNMQAYSVLASVHTSDPTHELAATNSHVERASGHEADQYYRTNHPEHLAAHHPGYTTYGRVVFPECWTCCLRKASPHVVPSLGLCYHISIDCGHTAS